MLASPASRIAITIDTANAEVEKLKAEVWQVCAALELMHAHGFAGYGDAYKQTGMNYSLEACEIAARMLGVEPFYAKMLNRQFRMDAVELMTERAYADLGMKDAA